MSRKKGYKYKIGQWVRFTAMPGTLLVGRVTNSASYDHLGVIYRIRVGKNNSWPVGESEILGLATELDKVVFCA